MAGKKKSKSPVRRFRDVFQEEYLIGNVESRKGRFISEDLYGWGDLLLLPLDGGAPLILAQITSQSNRASRRARMVGPCLANLELWLADSSSRAAWLATTGAKVWGQDSRPVIRVTDFRLCPETGAIIETDQWYDG